MNHIFSGIYYLNNKKYEIFINKDTWKKEFFVIEGNSLQPAAGDDKTLLDLIFNAEYPLFSTAKKVLVSIGAGVLIAGTLITTLAYDNIVSLFNTTKLQENSFPKQEVTITIIKDEPKQTPKITESKIKSAFNKNINLTEEEKEFLINFFEEACNSNPYIDYDNVTKNIETFKIIYNPTADTDIEAADAYYDKKKNLAYIYEANSFEDVKTNILTHEGVHMLFTNLETGNTGLADNDKKIGVAINEGFTEQYNYEVGEKTNGSYKRERYIIKILAELVGANTIFEACSKNDNTLIINELAKILGTEDDAISLISTIDSVRSSSGLQAKLTEIKNNSTGKEKKKYEQYVEDNIKSTAENLKFIKSSLTNYYEAKYERNIENDLLLSGYLEFLVTEESEFIDNSRLTDIEKNYFHKPAIQSKPETTFIYGHKQAVENEGMHPVGVDENGELILKWTTALVFQTEEVLLESNRYTDIKKKH